ncbi:centrosomal protein of 95 kDa [Rhinophrynus dorsalis]
MSVLVRGGWVDVANNLLSKCHISLQVREVTECDAHVFVALYEAILGDKVPDFIPCSQSPEDDAHNVQSVIDSLALDYLQVSLSHITGENIVRGDTESIQNLLEIFDGLLEYLTEQISEASSQNEDDLEGNRDYSHRGQHEDILQSKNDLLPTLRPPPSAGSSAPSCDRSVPSWEVDGTESTSELIRLGETAHTFTVRGSDLERSRLVQTEEPVTRRPDGVDDVHRSSLSPPQASLSEQKIVKEGPCVMNGFSSEGIRSVTKKDQVEEEAPSAIPLNRPYQPRERQSPASTYREHQQTLGSDSASLVKTGSQRAKGHLLAKNGTEASDPILEGTLETRQLRSPDQENAPRMVQNGCAAPSQTSPSSSHKKVAFRTLPDVRFMTLRGSREDWTSASEGELDSTGLRPRDEQPDAGSECSLLYSQRSDFTPASITDEPLSVQRARNKLSELELQEMSDKLARRLDELDLMLKKALGEQATGSEPREEDKLSQHSDSIMEFRRKKQLQATQNPQRLRSKPRSLSSSPTPLSAPGRSLRAQFEDALHKEAKGEMGVIRRGVQQEMDLLRVKSQFLSKAYKEELKGFDEREQIKLSKLRSNLKKTEQELKENVCMEPPKKPHPEKVYSGKPSLLKSKCAQRIASCAKPRRAAQMRIKENELLPLMLDKFPYLQISPHALNRMWKGQVAQIDSLARSAEGAERSERKLQNEVEEAQKKHDLLVDIIRKEQGQNQRLKDFKERIRLQKSCQNKMRENRQQVARAKRYYEDYHVQLRAKLMRARTREEKLFRKLFEEGLDLQKQRLREIRLYTKEQREEQRKRHKDELESLENYYKDQFSMLAEAVRQEQQDIQAQEKAQAKTLHKMKRELRAKMEEEIRQLQDMIIHTDQDTFFRELEAEGLKRRLQMATYQYSKSHCL